jgi:hypothetical protein
MRPLLNSVSGTPGERARWSVGQPSPPDKLHPGLSRLASGFSSRTVRKGHGPRAGCCANDNGVPSRRTPLTYARSERTPYSGTTCTIPFRAAHDNVSQGNGTSWRAIPERAGSPELCRFGTDSPPRSARCYTAVRTGPWMRSFRCARASSPWLDVVRSRGVAPSGHMCMEAGGSCPADGAGSHVRPRRYRAVRRTHLH